MKLYVDLYKVDLVCEQYSAIKGLIEEWGSQHGLLQTGVATNTSGEATNTFVETPEGMDDEQFVALYDKVKAMASDLEQAGLDIKALLNRVEEFYHILEGVLPDLDADYLNKGEPSERVAVLDSSNSGNMIFESATVKSKTSDENTAIDECCEQLSGLKKVNVEYAADKSTIKACIRKQGYISTLLSAFLKYCVEVESFNSETQKELDLISEDEYEPVTERTYNLEDMSIAGCSETILLNVVQEVLDGAGITEEEKQNALDNGMTLYQLAFDTSLIAQGDAIRGNDYGMTMWKMVLDGNYSGAFNTLDYSKNISNDNALDIWYAIADYQISSVSIDDKNNCDCSVFEAMMSEEVGLGDAEKTNLELGAYYVTMKKSVAAIVMSGADSDVYNEVYKDYSKSLALYNTIVLTNAKYKMEAGSVSDYQFVNDYSVNNMSMEYDGQNAVVSLTFTESRSYLGMDAGSSNFDMTISSNDEFATNLQGSSLDHQEELLEKVKEEQEKIALEALKGGVYLATDVAGYSTGVGGLYTGILKFSFAALEADYSSSVKTGASAVSTTINLYTKTMENKNLAGNISTGSSLASSAISDAVPIATYLYDNVFTSNGQDAIDNQYIENNKDNYSKFFGSAATCLCNQYGEQTFDQIQTYIPSPNNYNNYVLISSNEGGGIAKLMDWDNDQKKNVLEETTVIALIGNDTDEPDDITQEDVEKVINGGYDFKQECGYTKFARIMETLSKLNTESYGNVEEEWIKY